MVRRSAAFLGVVLLGCAAPYEDSRARSPAAPRLVLGPRHVGALVRVQLAGADTAWRLGMFQRKRVEPPCYLVLVRSPHGGLGPGFLSLPQIERMQVNAHHDGRERVTPPSAWRRGVGIVDAWREVALDSLQRSNRKQCPEPREVGP